MDDTRFFSTLNRGGMKENALELRRRRVILSWFGVERKFQVIVTCFGNSCKLKHTHSSP